MIMITVPMMDVKPVLVVLTPPLYVMTMTLVLPILAILHAVAKPQSLPVMTMMLVLTIGVAVLPDVKQIKLTVMTVIHVPLILAIPLRDANMYL